MLRRKDKSWYAAVLQVPREKLGQNGTDKVEILNLKCDPLLIGSLKKQEGVYPAYHMNKEHWISIALDSAISKEEIYALLDWSYHVKK